MRRAITHRAMTVIIGAAVGLTSTVAFAAPAGADGVLSAGGHVWGYAPTTASYIVPTSSYGTHYAANDGGGAITVTRANTGRYQVRWAGLAAVAPGGGGIAHASAYGSTTNLCTVASWGRTGADVLVNVSCFDGGGAFADTLFTANYVSAGGTDPDAYYSYLWASQPTTASYAPPSGYSYDSRGVSPWVFRDGVGDYRAYLPSTYTYPDQETTFYQTTAYGVTAVSCKVTGYLGGGVVRVRCRDSGGALVDSRFSVTFTAHNLLLRIAPTSLSHVSTTASSATFTWNSDSSLSHLREVARLGVGNYRVYYPQIASPYGHAVARATGTADSRCHVGGWYSSGSDEYLFVRCVNSGGTAVDSPFVVAFTW